MADATIPESFTPRTVDEIEQYIENYLIGTSTNGFSGFFTYSPDRLWIRSLAAKIREEEILDLATLLSGWVDYCDGVDEEKLDRLGLGDAPVEPEDLNPYLFSRNLDKIGAKVGVERYEGQRATGTVEFSVADNESRVDEGTIVTTDPISSDKILQYRVDVDDDGEIDTSNYKTPEVGQTVEVGVIAEEVGSEYNVGSTQITNISDRTSELNSVVNRTNIDGGEDREDDDTYRERIKTSVDEETFGGTTDGLKAGIRDHMDEDIKIEIDEYNLQHPIYTEVIVNGGDREELLEAIEANRPVATDHRLIRPEEINIAVDCTVVASGVSRNSINRAITNYLNDMEIGEDFYEEELVDVIHDVDPDIRNIETLNVDIERIESERHEYTESQSVYQMDVGAPTLPRERFVFVGRGNTYSLTNTPVDELSVSIESTTYDGTTEFTAGEDYRLIDSNRDDEPDKIQWLEDGNRPDIGDTFTATYETLGTVQRGGDAEDIITYREGDRTYGLRFEARDTSFHRIEDENGTNYTRGQDWNGIDRTGNGSIDVVEWIPDGENPPSGTPFYPDYEIAGGTVGAYEVVATVDGTEGTVIEEDTSWTSTRGGDNFFDVRVEWKSATDDGNRWKNSTPVYPDEGTEFTASYYLNQPLAEDFRTTDRQKISAGGRISVTIYEDEL